MDASRNRDVYTKGDTHWNGAGAFVAYEKLAAELGRLGVRIHTVDERTMHRDLQDGEADLYRLGGIGDMVTPNMWLNETFASTARPAPLRISADDRSRYLGAVATESDGAPGATLVAFGDSFLGGLQPFLAASFSRALFLSDSEDRFLASAVVREKPAVVLQEVVERNLIRGGTLAPDTPAR